VQRFITVVSSAAQGWSQPRPPKVARPFHLVFQSLPTEEDSVLKRWQAAGMQLHKS
jgi:hypothetical protein